MCAPFISTPGKAPSVLIPREWFGQGSFRVVYRGVVIAVDSAYLLAGSTQGNWVRHNLDVSKLADSTEAITRAGGKISTSASRLCSA